MSQEINEQEQIEKPKSTRRGGSRKKTAAAAEAETSAEAKSSNAAAPAEKDAAEKSKTVRRTRKSASMTSDEAEPPAPDATRGVTSSAASDTPEAPAKPRRSRAKKAEDAAPAEAKSEVKTKSETKRKAKEDKDAAPLLADGEQSPTKADAKAPEKTTRRRTSPKSERSESPAVADGGTSARSDATGDTPEDTAAGASANPADRGDRAEDAASEAKAKESGAKGAPRKRRSAGHRAESAAIQASLIEISAPEPAAGPATASAPVEAPLKGERVAERPVMPLGEDSAEHPSGPSAAAPAHESEPEKTAPAKPEADKSDTDNSNREEADAQAPAEPRTDPEATGRETAEALPETAHTESAPARRKPGGKAASAAREERRPSFYDNDSVVSSILPVLDERDQNYANRNFRQNSYGNDRRRSGKNRLYSARGQHGARPGYGQDYPPLLPGPMSYDDMPPLPGYGQDSKRQTRGRKRRPGVNGNVYDPYAQPAFTPPYPGYDPQYEDPDAILPVAQKMLNGRTDDMSDDFEDDGPQPALPGQPSLALPPSEEEFDPDALDEAVNGNRVQPQKTGRQSDYRNERRSRRDGRPDFKPDFKQDTRPGRLSADKSITEDAAREGDAVAERAPKSRENSTPLPPLPRGTKRVLYVSVVPDEQVEVVITDNGQVAEYFVEMAHQAKIRGNIYKGVINNVDINLQAAFVNFGGGKNGFLQIDEVHPEYWLNHHDSSKGPKYPPIQKVLKNGQEVLVQVVKEPAGTKGAFLTTWISLAGRYLVLTPGQEQIGVSRKVEDNEERARLKELLTGIEPGEDMGVIIRTASEGASKTSIQKDLQYLKRLWKDIRKKGMTEKAPCLIYQEADLAARAVRDYLAEDIHEIWVDDEATQGAIRETTNLLFPRRTEMVKLHQDPRQTLWERFNLQRQLEEVTSREVVLPSGGRLVFDQTEALMAIDINSGKTQGKSNFESMVFRTNMEAAETIARHLRLRDIGGQVVIDFIEMRDRNHCREVEKTLRNAMRLDRARHDVGHMSSFGLLELVRQRTGTSAISISTEPCPFCHGTGVRRNMEWQALQTLREIQRKLAKLSAQENRKKSCDRNGEKPATLAYETDFELGLYLLNRKRDRLSELETRYNIHIEIQLKH